MGWSSHHKNGLIYYNPQLSYRGYTLVATNRGGSFANLIDMEAASATAGTTRRRLSTGTCCPMATSCSAAGRHGTRERGLSLGAVLFR